MPAPLTESQNAKRELVGDLKAHAGILGGFVGLLWVIQIVNTLLGGALIGFGVHPRSIEGLWGILFAPFLHAGFGHLVANTAPLLVLGALVMARRKRDFFIVSAIAALVGGLGTWLIAPAATVHVGASVLIFGYLGYLLSRGIFERRFWTIALSVVVFFLYGGALFGILPGELGISWQGHLFGLLGGILSARLLRTPAGTSTAKRPAGSRIAADRPSRARVGTASNEDIDDEEDAGVPRRARQIR